MAKLNKAINEFPQHIFPFSNRYNYKLRWLGTKYGTKCIKKYIPCKVVCDLREDQDVYYYNGYYVPANKMFVQRKTHKKKRINKKWLKRYGYDLLDFPDEYFKDLNNRIKDFGKWVKQDLAKNKETCN